MHHWGIRKDESGIIILLHPDSGAYAILMKNDKILEYGPDNSIKDQINFKIERLGKIKEVSLSKNTKKYFPKFIIQIKEDHSVSLNKLLGE